MIKTSVIIPTYNSKEDLRTCLRALAGQAYPKDQFEIIVVDDGSTDGTEALVKELEQTNGVANGVRYVKQSNRGPAVARNAGIREAKGEIVVFIDADCIADADWLKQLDESFEDQKVVGASGSTISPEVLVFPWKIAPAGFGFTTCNMAYRRDVLNEAGGFNEKFEAPYYEDTDLALRIERNFGKIIQNDRAIVIHPPRKLGFKGLAKQAFLHKYDSLMLQMYPGYIGDFGAPFRPVFWGFSTVGLSFLILLFLFNGGIIAFGGSMFLPLILFLAAGCAFFLFSGYRLCVSSWPGNADKEAEDRLSLYEKFRTVAALLFYIPLFLLARIVSSFKYKKFLF